MLRYSFRNSLALVALVGSCSLAQAQTKIAVVNLQKVFDGYYRTKQADTQLKEAAGNFEKSRRTLFDDYSKANEEYKRLLETSNDPAISNDERDKRKKEAEKKGIEIKQIEDSIRAFDRTSQQSLGDQQRRMRDNVLRDIQEVVNEKAKAGGYTIVLDTAAQSIVQAPVFLYVAGESDLSDAVLTQLNVNAPTDIPKPKDDKEKEKK